jgi:hypothetical protein
MDKNYSQQPGGYFSECEVRTFKVINKKATP